MIVADCRARFLGYLTSEGAGEMSTWEYAEIQYSHGAMGDAAYIWLFQNSKLQRIKGIDGLNKAMVALQRLGADGWELVGVTTGVADLGPQTTRLFLKRPL